MQAVCFQRVQEVACVELADPEIETSTDALVAVEMSGLCGSDLHPYHGREIGLDPGTVMGHEFVGQVVAVGKEVSQFREGDRVCGAFSTSCGACFYCQRGLTSRCERGQLLGWRSGGVGLHGCQATMVRVPLADGTLVRLDSSISNRAALLLGDNLSTGFYCADLAGVAPQGVSVVVGCGPVGLICVMAARAKGAERIVAVDFVPHRREVAARLGAQAVAPEEAGAVIADATDGRGADSVMELVGLPEAQRLAFEAVRPGGVLAVVGCHCSEEFAFSPVSAYNKNLTYRTGRCPARAYMEPLARMLVAGVLEVDFLINHVFELSDCQNAYEVFANRRDGCLKAAFVPGTLE